MVPLVLWAIPRGTMRAVGCGTWSGVRGGRLPFFFSPFLLYPSTRGRIWSAPEYRSTHVNTFTNRYCSAYSSTESSGGPLHCRARTGVCRRWPRLRNVYLLFSHWLPRNRSTLYCTGYLLTTVLTLGSNIAVLLLIQSGSVGASRGTPFIPLLLLPAN